MLGLHPLRGAGSYTIAGATTIDERSPQRIRHIAGASARTIAP
jgi:hypothetical protein